MPNEPQDDGADQPELNDATRREVELSSQLDAQRNRNIRNGHMDASRPMDAYAMSLEWDYAAGVL